MAIEMESLDNRLPLRDIPSIKYGPGSVATVKQRSQIGKNNRREQYAATPSSFYGSSPSRMGLNLSGSTLHSGKGSLNVSAAGRSRSALGFNNSNAGSLCPSPELLDACHTKGARHPVTADTFFFESRYVGCSTSPTDFSHLFRHGHLKQPPSLPENSALLAKIVASRRSPSPGDGPAVALPGLVEPPERGADTLSLRKKVCDAVASAPVPKLGSAVRESPSKAVHDSTRSHETDSSVLIAKQKQFFAARGIVEDKDSTMVQLPLPAGTTRHGYSDRRSRLPLTQPPAGCGVYASESDRFAQGNRGLHMNVMAQEDKLRGIVVGEVRALRRRGVEERAVRHCQQVDQHPLDVDAARVNRIRASEAAADARALEKNLHYQRHCH